MKNETAQSGQCCEPFRSKAMTIREKVGLGSMDIFDFTIKPGWVSYIAIVLFSFI